jgi:ADP-ribose pyrophosphatase
MDLKEIPVTKKTVYEGLIVRVRQDQVQLMDGSLANREVVEHPGGVAILAINEQDEVVMVRQFRYPAGEAVLELPAGKLEPGEDPQLSALRELEEETGIRPGKVTPMGFSYSSPGIFAEKIYFFLAQDLIQGEAHPEEGEFLEVLRIPLSQLIQMVGKGELTDAKTIVGIMRGSLLLRGEAFA